MLNFIPAKILSYDAATRTAQVHIDGLTDGAEDGFTADGYLYYSVQNAGLARSLAACSMETPI